MNDQLFLIVSRGASAAERRPALVSTDQELIRDVLDYIAGTLSGLGITWPVSDADRADVVRLVRDGGAPS